MVGAGEIPDNDDGKPSALAVKLVTIMEKDIDVGVGTAPAGASRDTLNPRSN